MLFLIRAQVLCGGKRREIDGSKVQSYFNNTGRSQILRLSRFFELDYFDCFVV